jgi:hypothetical protein
MTWGASLEVFLSAGWVVLVVLASIILRRRAGKPLMPALPPDPLYGETRASGGMASYCLIVAVTDEALLVTPRLPFNLMFLPEVLGFEHNIPIESIREVSAKRRWWRSNVRVRYGPNRRSLDLKVLDPVAFERAVERGRSAMR